MAVRPAIFDSDVAALDVAVGVEAIPECGQVGRKGSRCKAAEIANHRSRLLLRARRKRPRRCRTPEQRHELPSPHSITSSARASTELGRSRPSDLAVFRLITSSYLVGACTGRSAGFSPLRMRSTYPAACRFWSIGSGP